MRFYPSDTGWVDDPRTAPERADTARAGLPGAGRSPAFTRLVREPLRRRRAERRAWRELEARDDRLLRDIGFERVYPAGAGVAATTGRRFPHGLHLFERPRARIRRCN